MAFTTPNGRTVYGGGGIVPDIYLENKASLDEEWSNYILRSNVINHFVFTELDKRRNEFKDINREAFVGQPLQDDRRWLEALENYIETEEVPLKLEDTELAKVAIQSYLGLQLFDEATRLSILHQQDEFVQKALNELKKRPLD